MPGDELHEEADGPAKAVPGGRRERTSPRHAAPKKHFLTRLHVPAGKAVALAAMPSAVLMSMGITPQLAYAKPLPKNPFRDGPCVTQPDRAEEEAAKEAEAEREAAEKARKKAEAERRAEEEKQEQEAGGDAGSSTSGGSADGGTSGGSGSSGGASGGSGEPEPDPSPSGEEDTGGGLLGGILGGLLGGGDGGEDEQKQADAPAEPQPAEAGDSPEAGDSSDAAGSAEGGSGPVGDAVDGIGKGLEDTVGGVEDALGNATDALPDPSAEDEADEPGAGETAPGAGEDGAFPCVEEKKVAGTDEQTPTMLPNQPWTLKASSLTIRGQDYEGVFNVRTANGETKQVLKFTAQSVDIGDLHQIVQGPNGLQYHVQAAPGSTSTIREGQVTLYTERLEGKLFGLIPIVFDAEHPPPLNLPDVFFTDVTVQQAGQFGGTLTVPGLNSTISTG